MNGLPKFITRIKVRGITLQIMKNYSDLLTEIDIIKDRIEMTEQELEYWFRIDKDGNGIPLVVKVVLSMKPTLQ